VGYHSAVLDGCVPYPADMVQRSVARGYWCGLCPREIGPIARLTDVVQPERGGDTPR